jgi:hypothetical protein
MKTTLVTLSSLQHAASLNLFGIIGDQTSSVAFCALLGIVDGANRRRDHRFQLRSCRGREQDHCARRK